MLSTMPLKTSIILVSTSPPHSLPKEVNFGASKTGAQTVLQGNLRLGRVLEFIPANPSFLSALPAPPRAWPSAAPLRRGRSTVERQSPWPRAPPPPPALHTDSGARMSVSPSVTDGAVSVDVKGLLWSDLFEFQALRSPADPHFQLRRWRPAGLSPSLT